MFKSLTRLFGNKSKRQTVRRSGNDRKSSPQVEWLEARLTPATRVWDGGSLVNSNWSTAANWVGDVAPVPGADVLEFPDAAARKPNTNNFVGATFPRIAFTGSGYALGGNPLTLGANLAASPDTSSNSINLNLNVEGNRTLLVGAGSILTMNGVLGDDFLSGGVHQDRDGDSGPSRGQHLFGSHTRQCRRHPHRESLRPWLDAVRDGHRQGGRDPAHQHPQSRGLPGRAVDLRCRAGGPGGQPGQLH